MKLDAFFRYSKKILLHTVLLPLHIFPVKEHRILLMNALALNYSDSPKYVADYLLTNFPGRFEIIYPVRDLKKSAELRKKGLTVVKYNSFLYLYYALTSHVFLTNSGGFSYLPIRKKQYVINTWHGGGAYKKCGLDMYEDTPLFRKDLMLASSKTSLFLSTCQKFTDVISASMLTPKEVFWNIGMPRNDLMLRPDPALRQTVRDALGLQADEKLVLFAPTYRKPKDNYFRQSIAIPYGIDSDRVCQALSRRFGSSWRFAYRLHPCVTNRDSLPGDHVMDLSDYPDMQELLLAADVLITDFSSSIWDFMLTGKPCLIFAMDKEHYVKTTQVYTPVEEWPFPLSTDNDELEKIILEFDEDAYEIACKQHYSQLGGSESGDATRLVCNRIYEYCYGLPAEDPSKRYLFINSVAGFGSTGKIAAAQCNKLMEQGHKCMLAFGRDMPSCGNVPTVRIGSTLNCIFHGIMTRLFDNHSFCSTAATRQFLKTAQAYDPDVLWLHNLHGYYLNVQLLFDWIKSRPNMQVKWTLHDCWSFTGHCAHFEHVGCDKWKTGCHNCPQKQEYPKSLLIDGSKTNYRKKKQAFTGVKNMSLVTPSHWLADLVKQGFLSEYPAEVVHNTINTDIFHPRSSDFREIHGLTDKKLILAVASAWTPLKGWHDVLALSKTLDDSFRIIMVGLTQTQISQLPAGILGICRTNDATELAEIYSTADVFINPTYEDTYPTVNLEARACQTRIVSYDTGGCRETLGEDDVLVKTGDIDAMREKILNILS